ncbi:conserved hypothetical protein [Pseudomonas protegens Pf-5]|jgi:Fic family protein|uniref:HPt domain-containing protein n=1 Tax=Pseudomonas fluorescens (strain ATCC BAA-477 / NRRL B-23932 / Pf-5) TaxID=220664 RepID=Q4KJT3_PSEF5|nr:conserved hypothetical protein [Pseudomonas protegens Pf-5]
MPAFFHHDLELLNPSFDSNLVDVLSELAHLRRLRLEGDTPPAVFYQLKTIFHVLESLGSARIEGNHTTLADYIESKVEGTAEDTDQLREVANIEKALDYIEQGHAITEQQRGDVGDLEQIAGVGRLRGHAGQAVHQLVEDAYALIGAGQKIEQRSTEVGNGHKIRPRRSVPAYSCHNA